MRTISRTARSPVARRVFVQLISRSQRFQFVPLSDVGRRRGLSWSCNTEFFHLVLQRRSFHPES